MIRIGTGNYFNDTGPYPNLKKFDSLAYSIVGSAVYTVVSGEATGWSYSLIVNAVEVSALRQIYAQPTAIQFVSDEEVVATAYLRELRVKQILNPTQFLMDVTLVNATLPAHVAGYVLVHPDGGKLLVHQGGGGVLHD